MVIEAGEIFARIGTFEENGKWSPHLHFQIMLDMLGNRGDFPGACTPAQADIWKSICPDPWKFLTGVPTPQIPSMAKSDIVSYRRQHLGKNIRPSIGDSDVKTGLLSLCRERSAICAAIGEQRVQDFHTEIGRAHV